MFDVRPSDVVVTVVGSADGPRTARTLRLTPKTIYTKLQNWESEEEGAGD